MFKRLRQSVDSLKFDNEHNYLPGNLKNIKSPLPITNTVTAINPMTKLIGISIPNTSMAFVSSAIDSSPIGQEFSQSTHEHDANPWKENR